VVLLVLFATFAFKLYINYSFTCGMVREAKLKIQNLELIIQSLELTIKTLNVGYKTCAGLSKITKAKLTQDLQASNLKVKALEQEVKSLTEVRENKVLVFEKGQKNNIFDEINIKKVNFEKNEDSKQFIKEERPNSDPSQN